MGMILAILINVLILLSIAFVLTDPSFPYYRRRRIVNCVITFLVSSICLGTIIICAAVDSYFSYLNNKAFYTATVEQYRNAIKMYEDKAVIDLNKTREVLTDFKYEGYQESIADMIKTLRDKVACYNEVYIKKNTMNDNWFFGWVIINNDPKTKLISLTNKE